MKRIRDFYGELTFNHEIMKERLSFNVHEKLMNALETGKPLDINIAGDVAHAMKEWAIEKGATHFTHWFQPQRSGTAEKHESFISFGENNEILERFSGKELIQSEPDASSFPSGGMRTMFEARGYTAWDPTSPAFLYEAENTRTLVIPSVYLSWTGEVLDMKTPLLRSLDSLNNIGIKLQRFLGNRWAKQIKVNVGLEQEYFLVDKNHYETRLDLKICGRTIFGADPIKGQQMADHYFGTISEKIFRFMEALDYELYRRGIPSKTRHNEVAPNQFEVSSIFEPANLAIDHNLQLMEIISRVADKFGLVALLSEKPFEGVNGSGKHLNWSLGDNTGANYFEPSKSPLKNVNFLITVASFLYGINRHSELVRSSVSDAGNDYRLGSDEAPPSIVSVYLGEYLTSLLDEIEGLGKLTDKKMAQINLGVQNLPKIAKDISDRNRTSPVAFTGNKFEFRAVGSSHNCSDVLTVINLLVAEGYTEIYKRLNKRSGDVKANAILVVKDIIAESKAIRYEGNNYSEEWLEEAKKRGLQECKTTPDALKFYKRKSTISLFKQFKVLTEREINSKVDIKLETYIKVKQIECKSAVKMSKSMILPAIGRYISTLAAGSNTITTSGIEPNYLFDDLKIVNQLYGTIREKIDHISTFLNKTDQLSDLNEKAMVFSKEGESLLKELREQVDQAETILPKDLWPMATYEDLLN